MVEWELRSINGKNLMSRNLPEEHASGPGFDPPNLHFFFVLLLVLVLLL